MDEVLVDGVVVRTGEEYLAEQPQQVRLQVSLDRPVVLIRREPLRTELRQPRLRWAVAVVEADLLILSIPWLQDTLKMVQELVLPVRRHYYRADRGTGER